MDFFSFLSYEIKEVIQFLSEADFALALLWTV